MNEKIYVPKSEAKEKDGQFGPFIKLGFHVDTLIEFARQHKNERGYLNLILSRRRNPEPDGPTHSVSLDSYQPGQRRPFQAARAAVDSAPPAQGKFDDVPAPRDSDDSVPF